MKKVLIVTYWFPPRAGVASLRLRGLAKYLPQVGWQPIILTAALPTKPDRQFRVVQTPYQGDIIKRLKRKLGLDPAKRLQEHIGIPRSLRQGRNSFTNKLETILSSVILYPSKNRGWCPSAIKAGEELLQKEKIDAIISSSPPVTTHLIAYQLKANHHIPWAVDLRDLWTQNHYYQYGTVRKWFEKRLEVQTLSQADALITVSEPLAEKLAALHKKSRILAITNGFDPEEIGSSRLTENFTITYTGGVNPDKQDPSPFFRVIRELIDNKKIAPARIDVRFFGQPQYWLEQEIKKYDLDSIVHQYGMVPRDIALEKQRQSQLLLLFNWDSPREKGVYTGKIFEYLAAERPILAIGGPAGVVTDLLIETGTGIHVSSLQGLKDVLIEFYKQYTETGQVQYHGDRQRIYKYSHPEMARKFAELLDSMI
jgi:glycosyltransferase involved in cell wall biosynthesis